MAARGARAAFDDHSDAAGCDIGDGMGRDRLVKGTSSSAGPDGDIVGFTAIR